MKRQFLFSFTFRACFLFALISCVHSCSKEAAKELPSSFAQSEMRSTDFSRAIDNMKLTFNINNNRTINAWLSKPEGNSMDLVIGLHGGTDSLSRSLQIAEGFAAQPDGGQLVINAGYAFLSLAYTEFEPDGTMADRGYKELEEVLAVIDQILSGDFNPPNLTINDLYTYGHSRGGGLALLAAIERPIKAAISAEGPLDWLATRQAIIDRELMPTPLELVNFRRSVATWGDPAVDPTDWHTYSPGLRVLDMQAPFLVISGYEDRVILISTAEDMQARYLACQTDCPPTGSEFILHPYGHTDWSTEDPSILLSILDFMERN